jgi:phthalate 4,5-dioxygenase
MLTKEENEYLTRVGPGTLMGNLIRHYWIPFYLSTDLECDGQPARVRLLGEDLVVYRDSTGAVGLLQEQCPHRGASLFFGRNEFSGLRCIYHGWKFDTAGRCLEMPNEPPESGFKDKIRQLAYPCTERNGVVWTYMGPAKPIPPLPDVEWNTVPATRTFLAPPRVQEVNFMQTIDGEYDSSHVPFLHAGIGKEIGNEVRARRPFPKFYTQDTDYGVLIGARYRDEGGPADYWRIYPFMMPFYTVINVNPTYQGRILFSGHAFVPIDDEHTLCFGFTWHPTRDLDDEERGAMHDALPGGVQGLHPSKDAFLPQHSGPYGKYWPKLNASNQWGYDYEAQRNGVRWSGIPGLWAQDAAVQRGYGPIVDRTKEHLGSADVGQIAIRRRLLRSGYQLRDDGAVPSATNDPGAFALRPVQTMLATDRESSWQSEIEPMLSAPYTGE